MKLGTVEPKYTDLTPMGGVIEDDALAFIYGAIAKYGTCARVIKDKESCEELKDYIRKRVEEVGQ